ncbi:hypothetical protein B4U79_18093 [Dinothrombium tinctorium]|uniref:Feline leukemia virus subgroup C receptor-related protein 2-like protein n=1 Tax=Dinothrombium tinctorium TaxID=1965070 RepID=A0A443R475_9ACAR|nr:hypothetical protein B4U79_18093 [Dinothrombium tinctorium]
MDFSIDEKSAEKIEYKTYKRRFFILLILLLLQSLTGSEMLVFSSLTNVVSNYYNVSDLAVNWLNLSGLVLSVFAFYPLTSACEKYGLRDSITTLAFLGAFGACIKLVAIQGQKFFWLLLIGQLFQSCSLQMSLLTTPTVASIWFKSEHTAAIMSSSQVVFSLGLALIFLLPDLIFKKAKAIEEIRNGFNLVLIPATVISVLLFLLAIFVIRDKPPRPPSAAQKFREAAKNTSKLSDFLNNKNFFYLLFISSLIQTCSQVILLTLNQSVLSRFKYGEQQLSISGFLPNAVGFIGTFIIGVITKKLSNYKVLNIINCTIVGGLLTCYITSLWLKSELLMYFSLSGYGICYNANLAIAIDFLFEVSYPLPSGTVYGISLAMNAILTTICTQLVTILMNNFGSVNANLILLVNYCIILFLSLLVTEDYRRRKADSSMEKIKSKNVELIEIEQIKAAN